MSSDQTAATNSQPEARLCKAGCGFFGSGATDNLCSKCFLARAKNMGCQEVCPNAANKNTTTQSPLETPVDSMDIDATPSDVEDTKAATVAVSLPVQEAPTATKKKSKKTSYKAMMEAMTKPSPDRDIEKEKEKLRQVTGGGVFSKIDKI